MTNRSEPWALFATPFLVRADPQAPGDHWQGGNASHEGARCNACEKPLTLLWDLDLHDPLLRDAAGGVLGDWTRLPLYFCWRCGGDLAYRLSDGGRLELLDDTWFDPIFAEARAAGLLDPVEPERRKATTADDVNGDPDEEFPYAGYPGVFPRRRLRITAIPVELHPVLELLHAELEGADVDEKLWLDGRERLAAFLGRHQVRRASDAWRGQLGGTPHLEQGHEHRVCGVEGCGATMRELASIPNDPSAGLPLIEPPGTNPGNHWVQVVFQCCPRCRSILALNRAG